MANPAVLQADTKLYSAAEPDGRVFPMGEQWPGDAWSASRGGEPVGKGATKAAMKDLADAQDTIDQQSRQLASKDHDLATMAAERDAANGQIGDLEQRAIEAERGQSEASVRVTGFMSERDTARSDFQRVSDQFTEANARLAELEPKAARVEGLTAELATAQQTIADLNGQIAKLTADLDIATAPKAPKAAKADAAPAADGAKSPDAT